MAKGWPRGMPEDVKLRQEWVICGKPGCWCHVGRLTGSGHGPYWYAYWRAGGKLRKKYLGTEKPDPAGPALGDRDDP